MPDKILQPLSSELFFWPHCGVSWILVPQSGTELMFPIMEVCSLNHGSAGRFPKLKTTNKQTTLAWRKLCQKKN